MQRRTAIRVIGSAIALAALGGCSTITGGRPTAATSAPSGGSPETTTTTIPTTSSTPPAPPTRAPDLSAGVTGTITWNTGSVPPPYNYTWNAEFTDTSGTFTLHTNYATDKQSWSQHFTVTDDSMSALTGALTAAGVGAEGPPPDQHLVGGPSGSYRLTTAAGVDLHASLGDSPASSTELGQISDAVEEFVGPAAWNTVMDDYQKWQSEQH